MSRNRIEETLNLPPDELGIALLALPEDQWFEKKSVRTKPAQLAMPLTALANAEGGTLIIGL